MPKPMQYYSALIVKCINICSIQFNHFWIYVSYFIYILNFHKLHTVQLVAGWEKKIPPLFRLISGITNLKSQGMLQIDWKESWGVQEKAGIKCSFAWCEVCDEEAKVNVLVQQFQFFTIIQFWLWKQWLHDDDVKWLLLFDSFICPCTQCDDVLYIFFLFQITCQWYTIWRKCSTIIVFLFLYNRCRWVYSRIL